MAQVNWAAKMGFTWLWLAGACLVGWWPAYYFAGQEGCITMLAAGVICGLAGMAGFIPLWWARCRSWEHLIWGSMAAMGLRLLITAVSGWIWAALMLSEVKFFALCLMIFYCLLLIWDTVMVVKLARLLPVNTCPESAKDS